MTNDEEIPNDGMTNTVTVVPRELETAMQAARSGFQSSGETDEQFRGIVRVQLASLTMPICHLDFVIHSAFGIRHSAFS